MYIHILESSYQIRSASVMCVSNFGTRATFQPVWSSSFIPWRVRHSYHGEFVIHVGLEPEISKEEGVNT